MTTRPSISSAQYVGIGAVAERIGYSQLPGVNSGAIFDHCRVGIMLSWAAYKSATFALPEFGRV